MKRKITRISAAILLVAMILTLNTFASSGSGIVKVPKNCVYTYGEHNVTRTRNYSYIRVGIGSVYPTGEYEEDTYQYCYAVPYSQSIPIATSKKIKEGTTANITLKEGSLNKTSFDLLFAGNSPDLDAWVTYNYNGL